MRNLGTFTKNEADLAWDEHSVGRRILQLREEQGLSRGQVSEACEVSPAYLYQIETGMLAPSLRMIGKVAKVLRIHPRDLFV